MCDTYTFDSAGILPALLVLFFVFDLNHRPGAGLTLLCCILPPFGFIVSDCRVCASLCSGEVIISHKHFREM